MSDNFHDEQQFAYKVRHMLDHGCDNLSPPTQDKLLLARQEALLRQKTAATAQLKLAGMMGHLTQDILLPHARTLAAMIALAIGVIGTYYWDNFEQAAENEEIDSALLTDDLPINAYLDHDFHAWLNHAHAPSE